MREPNSVDPFKSGGEEARKTSKVGSYELLENLSFGFGLKYKEGLFKAGIKRRQIEDLELFVNDELKRLFFSGKLSDLEDVAMVIRNKIESYDAEGGKSADFIKAFDEMIADGAEFLVDSSQEKIVDDEDSLEMAKLKIDELRLNVEMRMRDSRNDQAISKTEESELENLFPLIELEEIIYNPGIEREVAAYVDDANLKIIEYFKVRKNQIKNKMGEGLKAPRAGQPVEVVSAVEFGIDGPRVDEEGISEEEKLNELENAVNLARGRYAKADYKATNSISRIKQVLGRFSSSVSQDLPDVQKAYQEYRNSLNGILDYKIEELKKAGFGEAELRMEISNLTKYFNQDERRALYEAHTQARTDAIAEKGGSFLGIVAEQGKKFLDWRKKQKLWKKVVVGMAMTASGLGLVNRGIGTIVGGASATQGTEIAYRKIVESRDKKREDLMLEGIERTEDAESKFAFLREMLKEDIENFDKKLKSEKMADKVALLAGAGYGFLIGSGVMADLTNAGLDWAMETEAGKWAKETVRSGAEWAKETEAGKWAIGAARSGAEWASEKLNYLRSSNGSGGGNRFGPNSLHDGSESLDDFKDSPRTSRRIPLTENEMPAQGRLVPESPEEKATLKARREELLKKMVQAQDDVKNGVPLPSEAGTSPPAGVGAPPSPEAGTTRVVESVEISKGSSLEGTVSKHLQAQGLSKTEAGKMAHRMALQYAKEQGLEKGAYSLVHPGDSVQISPDGKGGYKISGFENKSGIKAGWMEDIKAKSPVPPETPRPVPEGVNIAGAEMAETQNWLNGQGQDIEEILKTEKELALAKSQVNLALNENDLGGKIETLKARIDSQLAHNREWNIEDDSAIKEQQKELAKLQSEMDKIKRFKEFKNIHDGKLASFGSRTFRYFFDQTGIGSYRDLAKYDANEFLSQNPKSGLARMLRGMNGIWKDNQIQPRPGENLKNFSSRAMAAVVRLKKNGSF